MKATVKKIIRPVYLFLRRKISKQKIKNFLNKKEEIFLEIGAGNKKGANGWLTIDMTKNCDIFWDMRKGIPFPSGSVSKIYSSHFFEHLTFKEGQSFLDECLRVLIPSGTFSICVPNAKIYIEAYLRSESDIKKFFVYGNAYNNTTKIDYINYVAYMDGQHKYLIDEENIIHILKSKGMKNVRIRDFDPNLDLKERDSTSIYAEAEKQ